MDKAARTISDVVKGVMAAAKPGVSLISLEKTASDLIELLGAQSALKNYRPQWATAPYPSVICLNVNNGIAHGVPTWYVLKDGDLLTIDCGILVDNFAGDCGITIPIGKLSSRDERLLRYVKQSLRKGVEQIKPYAKITRAGQAIQRHAKLNGFVVNKRLAGHGIGEQMHIAPSIPMYNIPLFEKTQVNAQGKMKYIYEEYEDIPVFEVGQVVCIEPYLSYKDEYGKLEEDQWTLVTRDGRKSAMAEIMVRVTPSGNEILTTHYNIYE